MTRLWPTAVQEVPATGHAVIEASAGTGKTYTLEHLVLRFILEDGIPLERILVVTFTEKATRELRERVRAKLRSFASREDLPAPARRRLKEALFAFDGATIATIHGFCQRVLTEQAFAGRRLFEQQHIDAASAFERAFLEVLRSALAGDDEVAAVLAGHLRHESIEALGKLLLACHKERGTLTPRWDPEGLRAACAVAPDPAALAAKVKAQWTGPRAGNIAGHVEALARCVEAFNGPDLLAAGEALAEAAKGSCQVDGKKAPRLDHVRAALDTLSGEPDCAGLRGILDAVMERLPSRHAYLAFALLPRIQERLSARKEALGLFDFDDMLLLVRDALQGPGGDRLVGALRRRFQVALIDEFQDTDEVQWEIFRRLFFQSPDGHRLVLIGDPKQAIYGFRNADVHTYLRARQEVLEAGGRLVRLGENWRSTQGLIDGYNRILETGFFTGSNEYAQPVTCGDEGRVALDAQGGGGPAVVLMEAVGEGPTLAAAAVRRGLGEYIALEIRRLVEGGFRFGPREDPKALAWADVHVLTRTNPEALALGGILRRHGIPYAFVRQEGLFQTDEAADVLALLRGLARPDDRSARLQAWLTPFFGVTLADLGAARSLPETHPLVLRLAAFKALADRQAWARLFDALVHDTGLVRRLLFAHQGERELTNYLHILETLLQESHASPLTPLAMAGRLRAFRDGRAQPGGGGDGDVQRLETERAAVQILTMHKAKGLEAAVVFVVGGFTAGPSYPPQLYHREGRRFAHLGWTGDAAEAIAREVREEAERLLYVAMTRAKGRLYLPFLRPGPSGYGRLDGIHRVLSDRLQEILDTPEENGLFEQVQVPCGADAAAAEPELDLGGWQPDEALLDAVALDPAPFEAARRERAPVVLTSYTRMKREAAGGGGHEGERLYDDGEDAHPEPAPDDLPGGRGPGIFLHELLEHVDLASVRGAPDPATWAALPATRALLADAAARHGLDVQHLPRVADLVWGALRTPVSLEGLALPEGLCAGGRPVREMPFVYPIPEAHHPRLGDDGAQGRGFLVGRGFVQGVVDLVFEHAGKVFLLDWKSDRLPRYDPATVEAHVAAHYADQARLYGLAVVRLLGLNDRQTYEAGFGGVLYAFLRGMEAGGAGLWFHRPAWDEATGWERWLLENDAWGVG